MSALAELQRALQDYLLDGRDGGTRAADAPALRAVVATPGADERERLHIYAHAYRARLTDVLGNDFPCLRALLGAEEFARAGAAYVDAHPSPHFNVRWFGERLARFLHDAAPWKAQPAYAELAMLEWALGLAFDAADEPVVGIAEVAAVPPPDWPRLRLRLHASVQRLHLRTNVGAIRRAFQRDEPLPAMAALDTAQAWVAWRKDSISHYRRLGADEAAAIEAIAGGATFASVCESLCEWHAPENVPARAAAIFRQCIEDDWVAAIDLAEG